jgi:hypothetical protein
MVTVYSKTGNTTYLLCQTSSQLANVTVPANGPTFVKIDNINNSNVDAFINWSTANTVTATIANSTSTGTGVCIQHGSTEFVQVNNPGNVPAVIYFAGIATANATVYITPVSLAT